MQTIMLNVSDSVADKLFWLLKHFDKSEVEILSYDAELEEEIQKGLESRVSSLSHQEVFQSFRAQYVQS